MEELTRRFEEGARAWQMPERVVRALGPFTHAIDLGAGSGYFTRHLEKIGRVSPVEPEAAFFPEAYRRIEDVPEPADLILMVNVRRFVEPASVLPFLSPGGRIAVVDWHLRETPVGPPEAERYREPTEIPGLRITARYTFLPHQWFVVCEAG